MSALANGNHAVHCSICGSYARKAATVMGRIRVMCKSCDRTAAGYETANDNNV